MKPVCCDTSFLVSLYGGDFHTSLAMQYAAKHNQPLTLSLFNQYEFEQALRFRVWRKRISRQEAVRFQAAFDSDCINGRVIVKSADLRAILLEARRLSARYTASDGFRTFDIIQVAGALHLGASHFLTFDANQRRLAQAEKLKVAP
jgi:predicted nucleic acid-binding protein